MKEFNLDSALNGEPFYASGQKCYIAREVTEFLDDKSSRRFVVIFPDDHTNAEIWDEHDLISGDIEMWEEPKISIEDLPKPFYPEKSNSYFYISDGKVAYNPYHSKRSESSMQIARNGQSFRTREDAQKWLDFMKSMME